MGYFGSSDARRARGAKGTYAHIDDLEPVEVAPGVHVQARWGDQVMLSRVRIDPGAVAEPHDHGEEQIGIVVSGSCVFILDGEERRLRAGDIYHAPPGVPHGARCEMEPCEIIDIFSPPRSALVALLDDLLP